MHLLTTETTISQDQFGFTMYDTPIPPYNNTYSGCLQVTQDMY